MECRTKVKILITGGAGYIGRVMTKHLLRREDQVRVLDSMIYGNHVDQGGRIEVFNGDMNDPGLLEKSIRDVDVIFHLGAIVGDQACDLDVDRTLRTNYLATCNVAHACDNFRKTLVFFSTCSVYGVSSGSAIDEDGEVHPLSLYASTKFAAEQQVRRLARDHLIFRLGTVFGVSPRMRFDLVVNRMIAQAVLDSSITVFGGEQFRPFIHITDVVDNVLRALDSDARGLYNLGGKNYKIREIGTKIAEATGSKVKVIPEKKDPRDYAVDSGRARKSWGATFATDVDHAVDEVSHFVKASSLRSCDEAIYNNAEWLRTHG